MTPWTAARQASLSLTVSQSLPNFTSIEQVMPSSHLIVCCYLLLLLSIYLSIRVSFSELALPIRWPKYWSFRFSISLSSEYSRSISFRIDWFDLLALQGIFKSLLQHHNLKASILWAQFSLWSNSHLYMTTGKTIALIRWTSVGKVILLLFNMLSSFVIAFLPRSKHLFISWLSSLSTLIL